MGQLMACQLGASDATDQLDDNECCMSQTSWLVNSILGSSDSTHSFCVMILGIV